MNSPMQLLMRRSLANLVVSFAALFLIGTAHSKSQSATPKPEPVYAAQHEFASQYVRKELGRLQLRQYPWQDQSSFVNRITRLKNCANGIERCRQAFSELINPPNNGPVSLVCLEVKSRAKSQDWSDKFVAAMLGGNYPFPITAMNECNQGKVNEKTYKISVVYSDCIDQGCAVRTYVKRIREWCATGWETTSSVVDISGFRFEVLDGLRVALLGSTDGKLSGIVD